MNSTKIESGLEFLQFLIQFQQIKRDLYATGEDRMENDAEHSFQLAMFSWFVNQSEGLNLNEEKILKYALIHDLVEVYAGDTPVFTKDKGLLQSKENRERAALEKIAARFQNFEQLNQLITVYSSKLDKESKLVHSLDKLLPVLNIYLDNFRTWKREGEDFSQTLKYAYGKIRDLEPAHTYLSQLEGKILAELNNGTNKIYNLSNYPKSYASIAKDSFRIGRSNDSKDNSQTEKDVFKMIKDIASSKQPVNKFMNMKFIGNGWEWSVFKYEGKVYKIPAGIFEEVNTEKYLENTIKAYEILKKFYPEDFLPNTEFKRSDCDNLIIQDFIQGKACFDIQIDSLNLEEKSNLKKLLICTVNILEEMSWMPDLNLSKNGTSFKITNVIFESKTNLPKIIDFTYYYDPFRLYPELTEIVVKDKLSLIKQMMGELNKNL